MSSSASHQFPHSSAILLSMLIILGNLVGVARPRSGTHLATAASISNSQAVPASGTDAPNPLTYYLPVLTKPFPQSNSFGVETINTYYPTSIITEYSTDLQVSYARLNNRISWRQLQPEENSTIDWSLLYYFEIELRTLKESNIAPIVVVDDYPVWATDNTVRLDGLPTSCGPLLPERYADFATFMQALVQRYSTPEFNVNIWELGNEPDVDPNILPVNSNFGCWGDYDDIYYNGQAYGNMLKVVTPAIKAIDPDAQVWVGGLLLNSPNTIDTHVGQPEDFLRGILVAGAAPFFDVLPYHAYVQPWDVTVKVDYDLFSASLWDAWGGRVNGKANFLWAVMEEYGVQKPLFISEISVICKYCLEGDLPALFDRQASMVGRSFPRALNNGILGFAWYYLEGPGWYYGGLLNEEQLPKPVYAAYHTLIHLIGEAELIGPVSYGEGIEAYSFLDGPRRIDVIFTIHDATYTISIPNNIFITAYNRLGEPITPADNGTETLLTIQFEPIYLVRTH